MDVLDLLCGPAIKPELAAKEQSKNNYALWLDLSSHLSVRKMLDWPAKLIFIP